MDSFDSFNVSNKTDSANSTNFRNLLGRVEHSQIGTADR